MTWKRLTQAGEFDNDKYQVWFFNACTTLHYMDEVRGGLVGEVEPNGSVTAKSNVDLRFVGTKTTIYTDALPFIQGLLLQEDMTALLARMEAAEHAILRNRGEAIPANPIFFED